MKDVAVPLPLWRRIIRSPRSTVIGFWLYAAWCFAVGYVMGGALVLLLGAVFYAIELRMNALQRLVELQGEFIDAVAKEVVAHEEHLVSHDQHLAVLTPKRKSPPPPESMEN